MMSVAAPFIRLIDRVVIRMARLHLEKRMDVDWTMIQNQTLPAHHDFFDDVIELPQELAFSGRHDFDCHSPVVGVAPECNRIHGKFYRCGDSWFKRPVIILLHGWNGENCYRFLFPLIALRCRQFGISTLMFELPCHGRRRSASGAGNDFICPDLADMVLSTRQSLGDARALIGWLRHQGCSPIGIWGISLGAWLAGLLACHDERLSFAVLMTPIVRLERAIAELEFCSPIRQGLAGREIPFQGLNLLNYQPLMGCENVLLVEGRYDLFAPRQWVEELWQTWDSPPIERLNHGHMSILFSWTAMNRGIRFVRRQAAR